MINKKRVKSKKAQGFLGLSFGVIWSIILIVFFIIGAFVGIRAFMNYQKCATLGLFVQDLQLKVNEAWNSQTSRFWYNSSLPAGVQYVCFVNLTEPAKNATNIESGLFDEIQSGTLDYSKNLYIYAPEKDYCMKWANIKHVDLSQKNPVCIRVVKNKVSIKIEKKAGSSLVFVGA